VLVTSPPLSSRASTDFCSTNAVDAIVVGIGDKGGGGERTVGAEGEADTVTDALFVVSELREFDKESESCWRRVVVVVDDLCTTFMNILLVVGVTQWLIQNLGQLQ